jgi:hypothetical protein
VLNAFVILSGMSNITKVATAGSKMEVSFSTYDMKDVTNVQISWNIGGSVDNKGKTCLVV